jgi:tRNA(fMet)-specific endonuclease VapC
MNYLLDTNACVALINGEPRSVRLRFQSAVQSGAHVFIPAITSFELWYGVAKSTRLEFNSKRLEVFFAGPIALLPFDEAAARVAGFVRAELERTGKPIGAYDLLIAAQAIQNKLTLITANQREFSRIKRLSWLDWAKA